MSGIVNTQKVDVAKCSHLVLDRDIWFTNFAHYKKSEREILFFVSGGRQLCRWVGYVLSLGISTVGGNRLSEMSVEVQGEDWEAILQEFVDEYERNQNGITPPNIKSTIKRCNWFVVDYTDNEDLRVCSSGFRAHITIRKTPPSENNVGLQVFMIKL